MKTFLSSLLFFCTAFAFANEAPIFEEKEVSSWFWKYYEASFGVEKIAIYFPERPYISHSAELMTVYAYDDALTYSLIGYYPPIRNLDPVLWFDEVLCSYSDYPYTLLNSCTYQVYGEWILDYTVYDDIQDLIIKGHAVITPHNAYTLKCVKPNGEKDYFDYFVDNFRLDIK